VNFKVTLDVQNTTIEQFAIQVPPSLQVNGGNAAGFSCASTSGTPLSRRGGCLDRPCGRGHL
jgi:hypothetical protein